MGNEVSTDHTKPNEDETYDDQSILTILPQDIIPVILSNLSNRNRCQIACVCSSFNDAIKLIVNNSITINWNSAFNKTKDASIMPTGEDRYQQPSKLEKDYDNLIRFRFLDARKHDLPHPHHVYAKAIDDMLYLRSNAFDFRVYVNDMIDLKWNIINLRKFNKEKKFNESFELGILITTNMTTANINPGSWHIGFVIGLKNAFAYHPGYNSGAARVEGPNGWSNESMGYHPTPNKLQEFSIFINQESHIYLQIDQDDNQYLRDWQYHGSLFMDEQCTKLRPNVFGLRVHNSGGHRSRIGHFGAIHMRVGKRNRKNGQISICDI